MQVFNSDTFQKDIQTSLNGTIYGWPRHASINLHLKLHWLNDCRATYRYDAKEEIPTTCPDFRALKALLKRRTDTNYYLTYTISGRQATIVIIAPVRFVSTIWDQQIIENIIKLIIDSPSRLFRWSNLLLLRHFDQHQRLQWRCQLDQLRWLS